MVIKLVFLTKFNASLAYIVHSCCLDQQLRLLFGEFLLLNLLFRLCWYQLSLFDLNLRLRRLLRLEIDKHCSLFHLYFLLFALQALLLVFIWR